MPGAAVRLFDLALARRLLALDRPGLTSWLQDHLDELKARTRRGVSAWLEQVRAELSPELAAALPPVEDLVAHWDDLAGHLAGCRTDGDLTLAAAAIAEKAAFGEERVALDEACSLLAVFGPGGPAGALSSRALFPTDGAERYLLLGPEHGEALVATLRRLGRPGDDAEALAALVSRCRSETGSRLAFLLPS